MCAQVLLRHGRLRMCRKGEAVRAGAGGRGMFVVINGLVRIGYRDPLGNTQEYFLATGARPDLAAQLFPCAPPLPSCLQGLCML
jgi:hypothetical protein